MKLLSLHIFGHDSNLTYFDGKNVYYAKYERLYQKKHLEIFSMEDFEKTLKNEFNISISEIDEICICGAGIKNTLHVNFKDVIKKPFLRTLTHKPLINYIIDNSLNQIIFIDHHYCHALSAQFFYENEANITFTIDGVGGTTSWAVFKLHKDIVRGNININGSIGDGIYKVSSLFCKSSHLTDYAGKFMGLQSYAKTDEEYLQYLKKFNIENLAMPHKITQVGEYSFWSYKQYIKVTGKTSKKDKLNWGRTIHQRCGEIILEHFKKYAKPDDVIHYAGGVAQNVIWNTELKKHFKNLIIEPPCGDEGLSLGGMEFLRRKYNLPKMKLENFPFSQTDQTTDEPTQETIDTVAKFLAEGKIVAWYQGHGEIGPRALGNRSLLMDPRIPDGKNKMNKVKNREYYRPFGASVLSEYAKEYFDLDFENPYMLYIGVTQKDNLQSITHVDGTCRAQTVDGNSAFRKLLESFHKLTGCPVLLNTSLNVSGNPIAGYIQNAIDEFNSKDIDVLVVGNNITTK